MTKPGRFSSDKKENLPDLHSITLKHLSTSHKIRKFANMTTQEFVSLHRNDNVRTLALQGARYPEIDMAYALDQIAGWQTACKKLPSWSATEGIVYPPHLSMEQCSSEQTARYKSILASRLTANCTSRKASKFVDLAGGFGVDFSFIAKAFDSAVYVERLPHLCEAARHNFPLLGLEHAKIVEGDGTDYLLQLDHASLIFIDPARRDSNGGKTVAIGDCTPNVADLEGTLVDKADVVMVKLSPMLDWHKAVEDLRNKVCEVHIVSAGGECKELLLVLRKDFTGNPFVVCVNDNDVFAYYEGNPLQANLTGKVGEKLLPPPSGVDKEDGQAYSQMRTLLIPNASIMKSGCFDRLTAAFHIQSIGANSHIFLANNFVNDFPGKQYAIELVTTMNKKELKKALAGLTQANIAVRNFPLSVGDLRKRLKLKDGGDTYIFATTRGDKEHVLYICKKL